jgi:hypothetical protein
MPAMVIQQKLQPRRTDATRPYCNIVPAVMLKLDVHLVHVHAPLLLMTRICSVCVCCVWLLPSRPIAAPVAADFTKNID